jgi:hypothetical protein
MMLLRNYQLNIRQFKGSLHHSNESFFFHVLVLSSLEAMGDTNETCQEHTDGRSDAIPG